MEDITQDVQEFASKLFDFARHGDAALLEYIKPVSYTHL